MNAAPGGVDARFQDAGQQSDPVPDLGGHVTQQAERSAEAAGRLHQPTKLVDQLTRRHDERADAGSDQCTAQEDQCGGKTANRGGGHNHAGDPSSGDEGGESRSNRCQTADVVEQEPNALAKRTRRARDRRQRVGDGFEGRGGGNGKLVRQPAPDQTEAGDRIVRPLDLIGVLLGDDHSEVANVLCRLPEGRCVDPGDGDAAFLPEQLPGDRCTLSRGHEVFDRLIDTTDTLIQRKGQQGRCRKPEPFERRDGRTGPGGRLAEAAGEVLGRLLDAGHRHAGQFASAFQNLDALDSGPERLGELGLCVDDLKAGADHGRSARGEGGRRGGGRDLHAPIKGRDTAVGGVHLPRQPTEALLPCVANALQLGTDFTPSDHGKANGDAFLSHLDQS